MTFAETVARLDAALRGRLPGPAGQSLMAPRPRRTPPSPAEAARLRQAAGLLLIVSSGYDARVVLTVRANVLRHGGQVSLPGGRVEGGETVEQAALREAREEIGLPLTGVRVRGALTPLDIPISGFRLHPVVATVERQPPPWTPNSEVARVIEPSVADLLDAASVVETDRSRNGLAVRAPAFRLDGEDIWGATAMVLAEFLVMLGWNRS